MNKYLCIVIILLPLFLTGCLKQKILDDVQLATAAGFELGDDENTLIATAVVPIYKPDLAVINKTYTSSSTLSKIIRDQLNRKSPKPFVSGKIEVALYDKKLAAKGIHEIVDTFRRDPSTGANMFLAVVDGDLKKHLQIQYGETDNGMYLSNLIEHNIESGILPKTNLHLFTKNYHEEGRDPILPFLKMDDKEAIIQGIALFKEDKYIDYIKGEDNYIFMFINEKFTSDATLTVSLGEEGIFASVFHVHSTRKYKVKNAETNPEISLTVKAEAIIQEYSGQELTSEIKEEIEKKMEEDIKFKAERLIGQFQELNIDPLGIGFQVRHRSRKWDLKKWEDLYPNIPIEVNAAIKISEAGVTN
ncbi:Ger(x)C family spore germination protein [Sutcliffiella halmapala]|uniref:Ger(x)C family spore germination protein n=1 Tax=Sutcliffiella halmapala TaxID=79882 RepID=UPI000994B940|nr:Ger(x)C family spore germination protein [Sutcliffiella halmapala]